MHANASSANVSNMNTADTPSANQQQMVWFTDIPAMVDGPFKPEAGAGLGWVSFEYELPGIKGTGLMTGARSPAGELVLTLNLKGTYILHIAQNPMLRVWLDGDTGYCQLPGDGSSVTDTALPPMDMTGKRLHIAPVRGEFQTSEVTVFYIRAEPCVPPPKQHRNLIITNDGHGVFCKGLDEPRDLHQYLYPYQNSDVFRVIWGNYGGAVLTLNPNSPYNDLLARSNDDAYYHRDAIFNNSLKKFAEQNADPLAVVRDATRQYGLELHYYCRMSAFYGPFPHVDWTTQFFKDNPQYRCQTEQGDFVNILSYACQGVQDYMLGFFEELLAYQPDGLCLAFNRGLPLMICEQAVRDAYEKRHGRPPVLPDECDSLPMLHLRHDLLTDFIRKVRKLTDQHGKALSCIVPRDLEHNKRMGLDVQQLADQNLFESILVGAGHGDDPALNNNLQPVVQLNQKSDTRIYGGGSAVAAHGQAWVPNDLPARARYMADMLDAGLAGGWLWDAQGLIKHDWQAMRQFGDRQQLDQIMQGNWPVPSRHRTLKIHDLTVGRYNPWHAY